MKNRQVKNIVFALAIVCVTMLFTQSLYARSYRNVERYGYRGVNGRTPVVNADPAAGNLMGILWLVTFIVFMSYSAGATFLAIKKHRECEELIRKLDKYERYWDLNIVTRRAQEIFFGVQKAWMKRDIEGAKGFMSQKLYDSQKDMIDSMKMVHEVNVLRDIKFIKASVAGVEDHEGENDDIMWLVIKGSRINYMADDRDNTVKSGSDKVAGIFHELWKIVRSDGNWVLDEVMPSFTSGDLAKMKSYSG